MTFVRFQSPQGRPGISSLSNFSSQPIPNSLLGRGCDLHSISPEQVESRWSRVAAGDGVGCCACCTGPCYAAVLVCSRCEGVDVDRLRIPPPCVLCAAPGCTGNADGWRCEVCAARRATGGAA